MIKENIETAEVKNKFMHALNALNPEKRIKEHPWISAISVLGVGVLLGFLYEKYVK